ncbi:ERF family protein [uncultured Novosphingobium sp.]|uniref:ERF family protein n=1 Tax=uncultured Novosphingobium sp. TaxID=292277 RepID=UPI002592A323|nr:ERF family protein [uncultured Novosphingobium sp.]
MNAVTPIEASTGADVPAVYMAISNVMEQMAKEGIGKDRRNTQQGYNFRGIDDVYNALCGVLASNRLLMLPFVVDQKREERQTAKGGVLNYTILTVDFKLVSALDGSKDTVRMVGEAMDSADKSSNKAQSAAMKYAALQVFMIPTEGDNDADATTHELAPREQGMSDLTGTFSTRVTEISMVMRKLPCCSGCGDARAFAGRRRCRGFRRLP